MAWGKKPYEVEGLSYTEREGFLARCSFFNNQGKESYLHLMQSIIKTDCLDFSYTAFFNLNLNLCNLTIEHGNVIFDHAHLYNSYISLSTIMCGGIQLFSPEISFRYISADNSKIDTMLMSQKLSIDFLCAQTNFFCCWIWRFVPTECSYKNGILSRSIFGRNCHELFSGASFTKSYTLIV